MILISILINTFLKNKKLTMRHLKLNEDTLLDYEATVINNKNKINVLVFYHFYPLSISKIQKIQILLTSFQLYP